MKESYEEGLGAGTSGTNYYVTTTQYDDMGNVDKTVDADGNITREVYDGLSRETSEWIGTNDTPETGTGYWSPTNNTGSSNMVEISANVYDNGGVGDGNVTETISFPLTTAEANIGTFRVTEMYYNWQDELVATKDGAAVTNATVGASGAFGIDGVTSYWLTLDPSAEGSGSDTTERSIEYDQLDNLGETTVEYVYAGNDVSLASLDDGGVPSGTYSGDLRAETTTDYDAQGRAYETEVHSVDQWTGAVDDGVDPETIYTEYDGNGNVVQTTDPNSNVTQFVYDGVGRQIEEIEPEVQNASDGGAWAYPTTYTTYDNDGNVTQFEDANRNYTTYTYSSFAATEGVV